MIKKDLDLNEMQPDFGDFFSHLKKMCNSFSCWRGDEDAERNSKVVVKTVDPTQGLVFWGLDLEVDSKSLSQEFLETSEKHLTSPAWWKWLLTQSKSFL